eukprot:gene6397-7420_t
MHRRTPVCWSDIDDKSETLALKWLAEYLHACPQTPKIDALNATSRAIQLFHRHIKNRPSAADMRADMRRVFKGHPDSYHPMLVYVKTKDEASCLVSPIQIYPEFSFVVADKPKVSMSVPMATFVIPFAEVTSAPFFEHLVHLRDLPHPLPGAFDSEVPEERYQPTPAAIIDWLLPTAATGTHPTVAIRKKVRVELQNNSVKFWIRSPMFTGCKMAIQLIMGVDNVLLYKTVMLDFLARMADDNLHNTKVLGDSKERLIKLSKRIDKVDSMPNQTKFIKDTVKSVVATCKKIDAHLTAEWEKVCDIEAARSFQLEINDITSIVSSNAICHKFEAAKLVLDSIEATKHFTKQQQAQVNWRDLNETLAANLGSVLDDLKLTNDWTALGQRLYMAEEFILTDLWPNRASNKLPKDTFTLFRLYALAAKKRYINDPISYSRFILTSYVITAILDNIAATSSELYNSHPPYLNINVVDRLLLTRQSHNAILLEVIAYFTKRGVARATLDTSIFSIKEEGFPYKYAIRHLQLTIDNIRREDMLAGQRKIEEVREKQSELDYDEANDNPLAMKRMKRQSVHVYENQLPENNVAAAIVVFDLNIPHTLCSARGALALLAEICTPPVAVTSRCSTFWFTSVADLPRRYISLGSTSQAVRFVPKNAKRTIFLTEPSSFIVACGKRVSGYYFTSTGKNGNLPETKAWNIAELCTIQIPPEDKFSSLQWLVSDTHLENEVISRQCEQPVHMKEAQDFVHYGLMRAGGHLQLRNLAMAIERGLLDMNACHVYALYNQIIYQVGPIVKGRLAWKVDANDESLIKLICEALSRDLKATQKNWENTNLLILSISLMAYFQYYPGTTIKSHTTPVLQQCRQIAMDWIDRLRDLMADVLRDNRPDDIHIYRTQLVFSCMAVILSYDGISNAELATKQGLNGFIKAIVHLNENTSPSADAGRKITKIPGDTQSFDFQQLLTRTERVAMEQVEIVNRSIFQSRDNPLAAFTNEYWTQAVNGTLSAWARYPNTNYWWATFKARDDTTGSESILQLNVQDGTFLVNGEPNKRLPAEITRSEAYTSLFGNAIFEVQSIGLTGQRRWRMSLPLMGKYYVFFFTSATEIGILEDNGPNESWYHIARSHVAYDLPFTLSSEYSHWINPATKIIEFRASTFRGFDQPVAYQASLTTGEVLQMSTQHKLIYTRSDEFQKIFALISRIELHEHIHVYVAFPRPIIHLPHYGLDFVIETDSISCRQYPGYIVDANQSCGTLIGFDSYLVLKVKDNEYAPRKIIVPNADLKPCGNPNITTRSSFALRKPPFFSYDLDSEFQIIRATDILPSLFMAYLHAMTSSPFNDPFTGLTGLESAMETLRHFNSNVPFSPECHTILEQISQISPKRAILGSSHTQTVQWNPIVHPMVAHECLKIKVHAMINRNSKLQFLFDPESTIDPINMTLIDRVSFAVWKHYLSDFLRPLLEPLPILSTVVVHNPRSLMQASRTAAIGDSIDHDKIRGILLTTFSEVRGVSTLVSPWGFVPSHGHKRYWLTLFSIAERVRKRTISLAAFKYILSYLKWHWSNSAESIDGILEAFLWVAQQPQSVVIPSPPENTCFERPGNTYNSRLVTEKLEYYLEDAGLLSERRAYIDKYKRQTADYICDKFGALGPVEKKPPIFGFPDGFMEWFSRTCEMWYNNMQLHKFVTNLIDVLPEEYDATVVEFAPCAEGVARPSLTDRYQVPLTVVKHNSYDLWETGFDLSIEQVFAQCLADRVKRDTVSKRSVAWIQHISADEEKTVMTGLVHKDLQDSFESLSKHLEDKAQHDLLSIDVVKQLLVKVIEMAEEKSLTLWEIIEKSYSVSKTDLVGTAMSAAGLSNKCVPSTIFGYFLESNFEDSLSRVIGMYILLRSYKDKAVRCLSKTGDDLLRELETSRVDRQWFPKDCPDWILFELEQRIFIRDNQYNVANELMTNQGCIQLQMGEGKTSVILPLIFLATARKKIAFRNTVIPSLLETCKDDIMRKIGGIFARKLYIYPYQRSKGFIPADKVDIIIKQLDECRDQGGFILATPEHRLSLLLKWKLGFGGEGSDMRKILDWWQDNIFDVLDECDELLSHKYQLVYPTGSRLPIDGESSRWEILQDVLVVLKEILESEEVNIHHYEYVGGAMPSAFPYFRILDADHGSFLLDRVLSILLEQVKGQGSIMVKNKVRELCSNSATEVWSKLTRDIVDPLLINKILVYRGLFVYGILGHSLQKIWSKDYGTTPSPRTKMAVPYVAKDTPSELNDFGQPCVSLLFTHLSYYWQGLSLEQFVEALNHLLLGPKSNSSVIYRDWVKEDLEHIDEAYQEVTCAVMSDHNLVSELHKIFRFNRKVINYWLSLIVLPIYTKQFPSKLFATPWDLAATKRYPTTGFSGTNDTRWLLPLSIQQKDLTALKYTNFEVINFILSQTLEHSGLVHIVNKENMLDKIQVACKHGGRVLIDVGALMVGKSNEEVAKKWLAMCGDKADGALYFDNNRLTAIDTEGRKYPHHLSPFAQKLDRVVVYPMTITLVELTSNSHLAHMHTMRKLGKGHTVCFLVSDQLGIPRDIGKGKAATPSVESIIEWVTKNTVSHNIDSTSQWASQGMLYSQVLASKSVMDNEKLFIELSTLPEVLTLKDMYSFSINLSYCNEIIDRKKVNMTQRFSKIIDSLTSMTLKRDLKAEHRRLIGQISDKVDELVPDEQILSTMLDEEQEREYEIEEERDDNLRVTNDFLQTVKQDSYAIGKEDEYVRRPNFTLIAWNTPEPWIVLLSQFEADQLLPLIRETANPKVSLNQTAPFLAKDQKDLMRILSYGMKIVDADYEKIEPLLSELRVFCGSKYFGDSKHQVINSFLGFLDLQPSDKDKDGDEQDSDDDGDQDMEDIDNSDLLESLMEKGSVDINGFVLDRRQCPDGIDQATWDRIQTCQFNQSPVEFLRKNMILRHVPTIGSSDIERTISKH